MASVTKQIKFAWFASHLFCRWFNGRIRRLECIWRYDVWSSPYLKWVCQNSCFPDFR